MQMSGQLHAPASLFLNIDLPAIPSTHCIRDYLGPGNASVTAQAHQTVSWRITILKASHFGAIFDKI
jgi:hypothetical protein